MKRLTVFILFLFLLLSAGSRAAISDFSITRSNVIFDSAMSLVPSVVKVSDGVLICCFQETGDAAAPGRLQFVRSLDNGVTWDTTPYLIMTSQHGNWGSLGGYLSNINGTIVLAVNDVLAVGGHSNYTSEVKIFTSTDHGQTFTGPAVIVPTESNELEPISAGIRVLSNGHWILPGYILKRNGKVPCGFWRSTDGGATWGTHEAAFLDALPGDPAFKAFNEVDIIERKDHSLLAVARTDAESSGFSYMNGQLYYCESFDYGYTWTVPQRMQIPGHSPALALWPDGTVMLGCRRLSATGNWLSIYIAADGVTFQFAFNASDPRPNHTSGTGYPIFTQLSPNEYYMAYYAGDSSLPWPDKTYCAGNVIHYDKLFGCGAFGYLAADLDNDCRVGFSDFLIIAESWQMSTDPDISGYVDCSVPGNPQCAE